MTQHNGPAPDLSQPLYDATIGQAFVRFWKKYIVFSGRASRSEYWWWYLIAVVVSFVLTGINLAIVGIDTTIPTPGTDLQQYYIDTFTRSLKGSIASSVWGLITLIGQIALTVRRLHDTNRSGWWYLIGLIPLVGSIILIVFCVEAPKAEGQRFDRNAPHTW